MFHLLFRYIRDYNTKLLKGITNVRPNASWNEVTLEANRISHTNGRSEQTGPTLSSRALAIVHLAMYDAYAASS